MSTSELSMSNEQFDKLRKIVYKRAGISFQDSKKYVLESRLTRRVEEMNFQNFDQYLLYLTAGPYQMEEFQEMFNRITINETSFFRNGPQLDAFESQILPPLLQARSACKKLRIWSAACSTGEEPYTIAIQLHRSLGIRMQDWQIEILGTDISQKALQVAMSGRYGSYSTKTTENNVLQHYFEAEEGEHQLKPEIRNLVRFELLNLKDRFAARRFGTFDVIFCRNVLIYFDDEMKTHCAKMFHDQLANDGTLLIGHSESLRNLPVLFDPLPTPEAFAYIKNLAVVKEAA